MGRKNKGDTPSGSISFLAGRRALEMIRGEGLNPDRIRVVVGAAGGPKWLVLRHLDDALFSHFFAKRTMPLFLIGSSIGAWRFVAAAMPNPAEAIARFERAYCDQRYAAPPTPEEVTMVSRQILDEYIGDEGPARILSHPFMRLSVISVRSRHLFRSESRPALGAAMAFAFLANGVSRRAMGLFFQRTVFYDPRDCPPFLSQSDFTTLNAELSVKNLKDAVMASGSIPLVMSGVSGIHGVTDGIYRDGGMIDYHPTLLFEPDPERIVLYPHYANRVIPGWLDKHLFWRRASAQILDNALIVCPSSSFIERLPLRKIPDRGDFMKFRGRDEERLTYWRAVISAGRELAEEFTESVQSGSIRSQAVPYAE